MEKLDDRVLAYKLAKEIDLKDLEKVSGGSVGGSAGPTGRTGSMDGNIDTRVDW
jgi:hypothetical protein